MLLIFAYVLAGVYLLAINLYAFLLVRSQKRTYRASSSSGGRLKIILAGALGGSVAAYAALLALRFKTDDLLLMLLLPVLAVINAGVTFLLLRGVALLPL